MNVEIRVPTVGESVKEAVLAEWYKKDGDIVQKDDPLFVIETDKVTLEVNAEAGGVLSITVEEGETVAIGSVVGGIETDKAVEETRPAEIKAEHELAPASGPEPSPPAAEKTTVDEAPKPAPALKDVVLPPSVRRLVKEKNIDVSGITGTGPGGRITKSDVILHLEGRGQIPPAAQEMRASEASAPAEEGVTRKPMSPIRRKIAGRLLEARRNTAMLTTFNDIDMSGVMAMREQYKETFKKKYGVSLGFMSFFIAASVEALKEFPAINAFIEDDDIVYHNFYHIGVAIGSPRGLVVPVIRNAETKSFAELERAVVDFVAKINENRLELGDLEGGTFTITNGGVFGSLLSTPILNTPQSGILGMHRIEKRPIVVNDEVVVRPMMYVALSYDHRIVDGREAVTCLRRIKEFVENPERMLVGI